jgi:hypothetical protein
LSDYWNPIDDELPLLVLTSINQLHMATNSQPLIDRDTAIAHLSALGCELGETVCLRFFYPDKDPRRGKNQGTKHECKFPDLPWKLIEDLQAQGQGCYFVVNSGGHKDAEITRCRAIFYEHDNLDKETSRDLWQYLDLPEPTIQIDTGGKSIHSFWALDCTVEQGRKLQADLLEYADGDRSIKNPSRVMRLAGAYHIKPGREPIQSTIISNSSKAYTYEELRAIVPDQQSPILAQSWKEFENGFQLPVSERVPLIECLSKANRLLIEQGTQEGQRNDRGYALACDLIGASNYLDDISQPYDGEPKALFESYCNHCSPPLASGEIESIWRSAEKQSTGSSLSALQIRNCIRGWIWRQKRDIGNRPPYPEPRINRSELNKENSSKPQNKVVQNILGFEETMRRLSKINKVYGIGTARWKWEVSALAKEVRRTRPELVEIYQDHQNETEPFAPTDVIDFLHTDHRDREWLIAGFVSLASTIGLIADGGVGKTLLIYDLCKAIATGSPWNGFRTKRSKVLIIQTDEPQVDTRERLNIAGFQALEAGRVFIEANWQFSKVKQLEDWIEQHFGGESGFVVIDSMSSANRSTQAEEKDSAYAAPLYSLRDIANRRNVTFIVLHHTNKMGGARGTTAFRNNLSEVWVLRKGEPKDNLKPTQRILEIEKSRSGCNGLFQIELNVDDYSWDYQGDFGLDENAPAPLKARILNWLEQNRGTKYEPEELIEVPIVGAGSTKEAIRKQLERMKRQGLVECEDRSRQTQFGTRHYKVYFLPEQQAVSGQVFGQVTRTGCPEANENSPSLYPVNPGRSGQASGQEASGQVQGQIKAINLSDFSGASNNDGGWAGTLGAAASSLAEDGREIAIEDKVFVWHLGQWEQAIVLKIPINASNGKSSRNWRVRLANGHEKYVWEREHLALHEDIKKQTQLNERNECETGNQNNHSP